MVRFGGACFAPRTLRSFGPPVAAGGVSADGSMAFERRRRPRVTMRPSVPSKRCFHVVSLAGFLAPDSNDEVIDQ